MGPPPGAVQRGSAPSGERDVEPGYRITQPAEGYFG